jgi:hypothetical protein
MFGNTDTAKNKTNELKGIIHNLISTRTKTSSKQVSGFISGKENNERNNQ